MSSVVSVLYGICWLSPVFYFQTSSCTVAGLLRLVLPYPNPLWPKDGCLHWQLQSSGSRCPHCDLSLAGLSWMDFLIRVVLPRATQKALLCWELTQLGIWSKLHSAGISLRSWGKGPVECLFCGLEQTAYRQSCHQMACPAGCPCPALSAFRNRDRRETPKVIRGLFSLGA